MPRYSTPMPQLPLTLWPGLTQQNVSTVGYRGRRTETQRFARTEESPRWRRRTYKCRSTRDGTHTWAPRPARKYCTTGIGRARVRKKEKRKEGCFRHGMRTWGMTFATPHATTDIAQRSIISARRRIIPAARPCTQALALGHRRNILPWRRVAHCVMKRAHGPYPPDL